MYWTYTTDEKRNLNRKDEQRLPSYFFRITKYIMNFVEENCDKVGFCVHFLKKLFLSYVTGVIIADFYISLHWQVSGL